MTHRKIVKGWILILLIVFGICLGWKIRDYFADPVERARKAFLTEKLETRFQDFTLNVLKLTQLELAETQSVQFYEQTSEAKVLWNLLSLPDVVVEAKVPLKVTYKIDLAAPWKIIQEGETLIVQAPELKAGEPAIDISQFQIKIKKWSFLRRNEQVKENFQKELMSLVRSQVSTPPANVKEVARQSLQNLIQKWIQADLVVNQGYRSRGTYPKKVEIYFPDELKNKTTP